MKKLKINNFKCNNFLFKLVTYSFFIFFINTSYLLAKNENFKNIYPCQVRLEFSKNKKGENISTYQLFIQYKNIKPQPITSISLHWLDDQNNIIGNSDADCRFENMPLGLNETGQCIKIIKQINSEIINRIGEKKWIDLINFELKSYNRIKNCIVVGQRYSKK